MVCIWGCRFLMWDWWEESYIVGDVDIVVLLLMWLLWVDFLFLKNNGSEMRNFGFVGLFICVMGGEGEGWE